MATMIRAANKCSFLKGEALSLDGLRGNPLEKKSTLPEQRSTCFLSPADAHGVSNEETALQLRGRRCVCEGGAVGVTGLTSAFRHSGNKTTFFISRFFGANSA